jgi:hypothetical protein
VGHRRQQLVQRAAVGVPAQRPVGPE